MSRRGSGPPPGHSNTKCTSLGMCPYTQTGQADGVQRWTNLAEQGQVALKA